MHLPAIFLLLTLSVWAADQSGHTVIRIFPNASCPDLMRAMRAVKHPSLYAKLFGEKLMHLWRRQRAEDTRAFIHVPADKTADLQNPFVAAFDDTATILAFHRPDGVSPDDAANRPAAGVPSKPQLQVTIIRSDLEARKLEPEEVVVQLPLPEQYDKHDGAQFKSPQTAVGSATRALDFLYKKYGGQGKGRSDEVQTFQKQDRDAAMRTTHFVVEVNGEVIGHIQAQQSDDPAKPLNLETKFPGAVKREKGELVIELGRLEMRDETKLKPETRAALAKMGGRDLVRTMMYQRFFSWVNNDAKCPRVILQMSGKGADHFAKSGTRGFGQWQFDDSGRIVVDTPEQKEVVLSISGKNLQKTEEEEMGSLISQARKHASATANTTRVFVRENEMAVIDRLAKQNRLPGLKQRVDFPEKIPLPNYDPGVTEFHPRTSYLYFDTKSDN